MLVAEGEAAVKAARDMSGRFVTQQRTGRTRLSYSW